MKTSSKIDIGATADFGPIEAEFAHGQELPDDSKSRESDQSRDQLFELQQIKQASPKRKKHSPGKLQNQTNDDAAQNQHSTTS